MNLLPRRPCIRRSQRGSLLGRIRRLCRWFWLFVSVLFDWLIGGMGGGSPAAILATALTRRAFALTGTAFAIRRDGRVRRGRAHIALLEGDNARLAIVASVRVLHGNGHASEGISTAIRPGICHEPLGVVSNTEVHFLSLETDLRIIVDRVEGPCDAGVVGGNVVATVHQVVGHDVDEVDRRPDFGALFLGEGDHVDFLSRDRKREEFVLSDFLADGLHQQWEGFDLGFFLLVGNLLVVLPVPAGVLPIEICVCQLTSSWVEGMHAMDVPTPSKPLAFNIIAMFFAYLALDSSVFAPSENPEVSPQPPMATMTLVSLEKRFRKVETGSKGVKPLESPVNKVDLAKAMMAWVIP